MKLLVFFVVCVFLAQVNGMEDDVKKCGEKLTLALNDACKDGFIGLPLKKKSVSLKYFLPASENKRHQYFPSSLANIFEIEDESFEENIRRARNKGIVDYCCRAPCSINQLEAYCKPIKKD